MKVKVKRKVVKEQEASEPTWMGMMGGDAGTADPDLSTMSPASTIPITKDTEKKEVPEINKIKELGYDVKKKLGQGKYGTVYLVIKDNTEYAMKVVGMNPDDQGAQQREVENYKKVQMARVKNPLIAKHFPKTMFAKVIDGYGYIVMEKLEFGSKSYIIDDMFQGPEATVPADKEQQHKSMAKKAYQVLTNKDSREALLDSMFTLIVLPEDVEKQIQGEMEVVTYLNRADLGSEKPESEEQLIRMAADIISPAAYEYIFNTPAGDTPQPGDLRAIYYFNPGLLVFLLKALKTVKKIQPDQYMRTEYSAVVEYANFLRKASPVPLHYKHKYGKGSGASDKVAGAFKEATSIRKALDALEQESGLVGRDMHDQNAMIRPRTGDVVIVDLGLFRPAGGSLEEKRKKRKKRRKSRNKYHWNVGSWYYGGGYGDHGDAGGDGGGGDGKRDDKKKIKIKIVKNLEEKCQKGYKTHPTRKTKKMFGKTYRNCVKAEGQIEEKKLTDAEYSKKKEIAKAMKKDNPGMSDEDIYPIATATAKRVAEGDPKKGTGKKPKGSGRRLYTDEDPSDTVSVSFKSVSAIQQTLSKESFKSKSHKRQSQIINLIHQRARVAYQNAKDPKVKARLKKAYEYAKKRKEASKKKTIRMRKKKK